MLYFSWIMKKLHTPVIIILASYMVLGIIHTSTFRAECKNGIIENHYTKHEFNVGAIVYTIKFGRAFFLRDASHDKRLVVGHFDMVS